MKKELKRFYTYLKLQGSQTVDKKILELSTVLHLSEITRFSNISQADMIQAEFYTYLKLQGSQTFISF